MNYSLSDAKKKLTLSIEIKIVVRIMIILASFCPKMRPSHRICDELLRTCYVRHVVKAHRDIAAELTLDLDGILWLQGHDPVRERICESCLFIIYLLKERR